MSAHGWGLERTLTYFKDFCRERGFVLKVVLLPAKEEVYGWVLQGKPPWSSGSESSRFGRWLEDACRELGVDYWDLKPEFVRESRLRYETDGELLWWYDDSHWNPAGHRLAADLVYRHLLQPSPKDADVSPAPNDSPRISHDE